MTLAASPGPGGHRRVLLRDEETGEDSCASQPSCNLSATLGTPPCSTPAPTPSSRALSSGSEDHDPIYPCRTTLRR